MNRPTHQTVSSFAAQSIGTLFLAGLLLSISAVAQQRVQFTPGNLVVVVEGCGVFRGTCTAIPNGTGTGAGNSSLTGYGDNQAAPLTLFQFAPVGTASATYVNSLVLPQTYTNGSFPVSGEYGSSSEGTLHLSGSGRYLTLMGYAVAAASFNTYPTGYGAAPSMALAQSTSLSQSSPFDSVARVITLIDPFANVNSTTTLYNIFNLNNPRSAYTVNGTTAYVSGQGSGSDATGGVFYTPTGSLNIAPTPITGLDTSGNTLSQDTRDIQIFNNTLYVSVDTKEGSNAARSYIGTLGPVGAPPTTTVGAPVMLTGFGNTGGTGKVTITTGANSNGNAFNAGLQINVSPMNFFFANPSTLYVADSGNSKQTSATSSVGDGGLQKWINSSADGSGTWTLAYTLANGLNLVVNTNASGSSGLYGLAGAVSGNAVQLYATNSTLNDLDTTYMYGITDTLSATTASQVSSETFALLATAPADSNFKGISFAPYLPPPITPVVTWPAPAAITFGSALSPEQLNAYANVPGYFVYTPQLGTVLPAGANQTLSVTFSPTDYNTYNTVVLSHTITVNPAVVSTPANLVVTQTITRNGQYNDGAAIIVSNTGGTAATNVTITSVKIAGVPIYQTQPYPLGTILPGASASVGVATQGILGPIGGISSFSVTGTYDGSKFNSNARVILP